MGTSFLLVVKCLMGQRGFRTPAVRFPGSEEREKMSGYPAEQFNKGKQWFGENRPETERAMFASA
jgi:hypothetical protein